ncbi:protein 60A [Diorhabda sublineata]|uniref:protein 60A n=1 Tax=Diorhabda sublineata TaxID=1163346 RepID=UPI0024E0CB81|nr:protein 60A [Diorhabda sublineata]
MQPVLVFCLFVTFWNLSSCSRSGIYIDNGLDQTAMERAMTRDEKKEMELEILSLLGLPKRPRKISKSPLKRSAPRFLLDIYKTLMEQDNDENNRAKRNTEVYLSGEEQHQIHESDVIMTFESSNDHVPSVRHERGKRLWFNVSDVPVAEDVVGAELRIFKSSGKGNKNPGIIYTVTAYQLIKTVNGEKELEYISAANITAGFVGWMSLNLTQCLVTWVAFPNSNKGIYLSVHPLDKPGHEIRPEDIGLITVKAEDEQQPFMVAFLKAVNSVKPRVTREARTKKDTFNGVMTGYSKIDMDNRQDLRRSCRIETLYINFKDLSWTDWIIAPEGYPAFYCAGECNFPLNAHMNATNHAIVQTLVHLMNPQRFPKPCCAPTKLNPISVLYYLDDQNVILKKYKKMVVKSCGCH